LRLRRIDPEAVSVPHIVGYLGCFEEGLAGDATGPGAVTADPILLGQGHL